MAVVFADDESGVGEARMTVRVRVVVRVDVRVVVAEESGAEVCCEKARVRRVRRVRRRESGERIVSFVASGTDMLL